VSKTAKQMDDTFDAPSYSFGSTAVIRSLPVRNEEPLNEVNFNLRAIKARMAAAKINAATSAEGKKKKSGKD
jgi:hypothetical protein